MIFECKKFRLQQSKEVFPITTDATLLGALAWNDLQLESQSSLLEVGIGTGIVSFMLKQRFPDILLEGIDINTAAIRLANQNLKEFYLSEGMHFEKGDLYLWKKKYDNIIINPPYFQADTRSQNTTMAEAKHLNSGYKELLHGLSKRLNKQGTIEMICPYRYLDLIELLVVEFNCFVERKILIAHSEGRAFKNMILRIKKGPQELSETKCEIFYLRNSDNSYSPQYKKALEDFLIIFDD